MYYDSFAERLGFVRSLAYSSLSSASPPFPVFPSSPQIPQLPGQPVPKSKGNSPVREKGGQMSPKLTVLWKLRAPWASHTLVTPKVETLHLRYLVGVVLNDTERPATKEAKQRLESEGYKTASFPAVDHAVTTVFPFRGSVSVMIAMARVYPKLREYIKEKLLCARPLIEIYEGDRVVFVCPLAKQDEFYVEETSEEFEEGATSGTTTASEDPEDEEDDEDNASPSPAAHSQASSSNNGASTGAPEESDHERGSRSSTTSSFEELRLETASN
ncbi:hypothetical protein HPB47_021821 [Ixodes persulcatus]|uniref:Uncharacterized protein n=1 Tax=Ixodes persulcatus TaxID=34615 RepID=A0AC60QBM8_IXOPE|nr:hypothetical protein HPB47_021821 [Ixodes persulcatus]